MNLKIILLLICILFLKLSVFADESSFYKVIKVVDGDTVYIDFNRDGIAQKDERVRLNGIDTFEGIIGDHFKFQVKKYNLSQKEVLGLGYLAKEFAKEKLLAKDVKVEFSSNELKDKYNRLIVSIYYNDNKKGKYISFEKELLKQGLALVYEKSNLAMDLKKYENYKKLKENIKKADDLNLAVLDKKSGKYYKLDSDKIFYINYSDWELLEISD